MQRSDGGGLGIRNLRERLEVTYPGDHLLECGYVENDDWNAVIDIPFERQPPAEAERDPKPAEPMRKLA